MGKKSATLDLLHENVWKTLISFAIPFMLSSLMQTLYNTVDTIVVGQFVGSAGISAVSFTGTLVNLSVTLCMGFSTSGQILIAQYIGAGKKDEIKRVISSMTLLIGLISIVLSVVVLVFLSPILRLLSTPDEAFEMAKQYMTICAFGIIFTAFYNMMSAVFRGMGDSKHPFIFIVIASITNIVLDLLFTGLFGWGVAGAALATVIGQAVSVVYSFAFLIKHQAEFNCSFRKGEFKVYRPVAKKLIVLGIPLMLSGSAINISSLFVARLINQLGVAVSAAFGVGQKLSQIPHILTQAIGQAVTAMIGQNLGARQFGRVRQTVRSALAVCFVVQAIFTAFCLLFPEISFRLFTQDATVLEYAMRWNIAMAIGAPSMVCMPAFNSLIQAVGDTKISMCIGLADAFIGRLVLTYLFGIVFNWGAMGLFIGFTAGSYLTALPGAFYYVFVKWENRGLQCAKITV